MWQISGSVHTLNPVKTGYSSAVQRRNHDVKDSGLKKPDWVSIQEFI